MYDFKLSPAFTRIARRKIEMKINEGYEIVRSEYCQVILKRVDPKYGDDRDRYLKVDPFGIFSTHLQTLDLIRDIKLAKLRLNEASIHCFYPEDMLRCTRDYVDTVESLIEQFEESIPGYGVNI